MMIAHSHRDVAAVGQVGFAQGTGSQHIVVIGIDRYPAWAPLRNAVRDASEVKAAFGELGFHVHRELLDEAATGAALRRLVTRDLRALGTDDSLVLFFAGHGHVVTSTPGGTTQVKTGYLLPVDAERESPETWLRLDSWMSDVARLPPRHILVVLDSCRSGIALELTRTRGEYDESELEPLRSKMSRRVITAAMADQLAADDGGTGHSVFTRCLLDALAGGVDGRPRITGSDLGAYVRRRVMETSRDQTPDFGAFESDDRGELILALPVAAGGQAANPPRVAPAPPAPVTLAVMGTRGGVGKGTFVAFSAQLLAAAGHEVAVIDLDLSASGSTLAAEAYHRTTKPSSVFTVFDHLAQRAKDIVAYTPGRAQELWDISPPYLARIGGGSIWLVPARNPANPGQAFNVVANIPASTRTGEDSTTREQQLAQVFDEIVARVRTQRPRVRVILVDCGADRTPLYGAAFARANAGYILLGPDPEFFGEVGAVRDELRQTYRSIDLANIHAVGNQLSHSSDEVRLRNGLQSIPLLGAIHTDPTLRRARDLGLPFDLDLGHTEVAKDVRGCLVPLAQGRDLILLDERQVQQLPVLSHFARGDGAQRFLAQQQERRRWYSLGLTIAVAVVLTIAIAGAVWASFGDPEQRLLRFAGVAAVLAFGSALVQVRRRVAATARWHSELVASLITGPEQSIRHELTALAARMEDIARRDRRLQRAIWRFVEGCQREARLARGE